MSRKFLFFNLKREPTAYGSKLSGKDIWGPYIPITENNELFWRGFAEKRNGYHWQLDDDICQSRDSKYS